MGGVERSQQIAILVAARIKRAQKQKSKGRGKDGKRN